MIRTAACRSSSSLLTIAFTLYLGSLVPLQAEEAKKPSYPAGIAKGYDGLSKAISSGKLPAFMPIFHRDFIFEATDGSFQDRGPWRRKWMDRFVDFRYDKVAYELIEITETTDEQIELKTRRVLVSKSVDGGPRHVQEMILADTWLKPEEEGGAWTLIARKQEELRTDGVLSGATGEPASSTIAALAKKIQAGNASTKAFWSEAETTGSPLVETVEGDKTQRLVTFLWRGAGNESRVQLEGGASSSESTKPLTRLGASNVWYRSESIEASARFTYRIHVEKHVAIPASTETITASSIHKDPLNPKELDERSLVELPNAGSATWLVKNAAAPEGNLKRQTVRSSVLGERRFVSVYTPADLEASKGKKFAAAFLFDRGDYSSRKATRIVLDNLHESGKLSPTIVFLIHSEGSRRQKLEASGAFVQFAGQELIEWAREEYPISNDPTKVVIGGNGIGGAIAAECAVQHPAVFGGVLLESADLSQSSVPAKLSSTDNGPTRWAAIVGNLESPAVKLSNHRLRDVLMAKGGRITFAASAGNHNSTTWLAIVTSMLPHLLGK